MIQTKTIAMILVTSAIIALALGVTQTHQAYSQPPATEGKPAVDGIQAGGPANGGFAGMERIQPNTPPGATETVIVAGNLNGGGGHAVVVQGVPPSPSGITSEVTKCVGSTAFQQAFDEPTGQPNACTK
jgi:hypothetical protein